LLKAATETFPTHREVTKTSMSKEEREKSDKATQKVILTARKQQQSGSGRVELLSAAARNAL